MRVTLEKHGGRENQEHEGDESPVPTGRARQSMPVSSVGRAMRHATTTARDAVAWSGPVRAESFLPYSWAANCSVLVSASGIDAPMSTGRAMACPTVLGTRMRVRSAASCLRHPARAGQLHPDCLALWCAADRPDGSP